MTVSYVVTLYNKRAYIGGVLDSLLREWEQTGGEIVVVDDGSTDGSRAVVEAVAAGRPHVRLIVKDNGGVASATNAGFAAAAFPLVRFMDADDTAVPGSTRRLVRALDEHGAGLAFGGWRGYDGDGAALAFPDPSAAPSRRVDDPLRLALSRQAFVPSSMIAVREAIAPCFPLPEGYRTSQDFVMSARFAQVTGFAKVDATVCFLPEGVAGRLSGSLARMYSDSALLLADEWERAPGDWPAPYRRHAVRRQAWRAYLYATRHLPGNRGQAAWLMVRRALGALPWGSPGPAVLRRIAATYAGALRAPGRYP